MHAGSEWIVDALGCREEWLADGEVVRGVCERIIADLNLNVLGTPLWHAFPAPGGLTGIYLLTESHLACHTFPELKLATFNLYCCRPRVDWPWREQLAALLGAAEVRAQRVARGTSLSGTRDGSAAMTAERGIGCAASAGEDVP